MIIKRADGSYAKLLKMKDPWKITDNSNAKKPGDWTGKYNLKDKFWTPSRRAGAGVDKLEEGEFFMSVEDFKDSFKFYTITHYHEGWQNSYIEKKNAVNKKAYRFNF